MSSAALSTVYESQAIAVSGLDAAADLTVAGGEHAINGGAWSSSAATVSDGDTVKVRRAASGSVSTAADAVLTIGGVSGSFSITTVANAETSALVVRFTADPGDARRGLIDGCIGAIKAAGVFAKLDVLHMFAAHDSQAARQNWIQNAFNATAVSGPIFTTDRGYAGDGAAAYVDTNFNDLTGSALWTQDTMGLGAYVNQYAGVADFFVGLPSGTSIRVGASTTNVIARVHSTTSFNPAAANAIPGHIVVVRDSSTTIRCLRDGASVGTSGAVSTASGNVNVVAFRSTTSFNADRIACLHLGGFLTPSEVASLYSALVTYLTAIGAN